jgi:hypothetical protein
MAVYGDLLSFFPEQFRQFDYFLMKPNVVASYTKREDVRKVTGVFQYMKKGELKREEDTQSDVNIPTFWTREKLKVGEGFIQKDDELYRIVNPADWLFEGGFNCYVLESFVGNSDAQEPFEDVDLGQNSYD